jgi:hypothetical protein
MRKQTWTFSPVVGERLFAAGVICGIRVRGKTVMFS